MADLYVEPPHLTIAVYSNLDERETFGHLCTVLPQLGCSPTYMVEVAAMMLDFDMVSDLGENRAILHTSPGRYDQLIAARESDVRVLRAGYSHRKYGDLVVEYEMEEGSDSHPIGVSLSAGDLGIPGSLWSAKQRSAAYGIAEWSLSLLHSAVSVCTPLYGAVGVEYSLPTPRKLADFKAGIPTEWFVSRALLDHDRSLEERLRAMYLGGEVMNWGEGIFASGWAPYNGRHCTVGQPSDVARNTAKALGKAAISLRAAH